jgi:hypothetical protein
MTLRVLTGGGVQLSFIVVASCVLALFIIGWRAGLGLIQRARAKPPSPSTNLVSTYPRGRRTAFPEQPRSEILTNRASAKRASEFRERRNRVAPS